MKKRLLVPLVPALACLVFAAPANAATSEAASENWAGYVATSNDAGGFSAVSGGWTEPHINCAAGSQSTYSAYWVGLGGGGEQSQALEQIGTQADCASSGDVAHYAWYELVPSAPVKIAMTIHAGDKLWARTAVNGDRVSLYIVDHTTGSSWTRTLTMTAATPDTSTAEWVAEAPSECAGGATGTCTPLPLADFGTAAFTNAYTTAGGHTGSISDSHWSAARVALEPSSGSLFGGGDGGYFGQGSYSSYSDYSAAATGAAPTALSTSGTRFRVKYGATLTAQSSGSGQPQVEGYSGGYGSGGYGGGYSGGYGYGSGYGYGYDGGYGDYGWGGDYGGGYSDGYGGYGDSYGAWGF